jgi:hypothetical protein
MDVRILGIGLGNNKWGANPPRVLFQHMSRCDQLDKIGSQGAR